MIKEQKESGAGKITRPSNTQTGRLESLMTDMVEKIAAFSAHQGHIQETYGTIDTAKILYHSFATMSKKRSCLPNLCSSSRKPLRTKKSEMAMSNQS